MHEVAKDKKAAMNLAEMTDPVTDATFERKLERLRTTRNFAYADQLWETYRSVGMNFSGTVLQLLSILVEAKKIPAQPTHRFLVPIVKCTQLE